MTSPNAQMIVNSWSLAVRHMWNLPLNAHRYLIEHISGTHAKTMLSCCYVKFIRSIKKSPKLAVHLLFQKLCANVKTETGRNLRYVLDATNYESVKDIVKHNVRSIGDSSFFEHEELDFIIDYLSTS